MDNTRPMISASKGMVSAGHYLAASAGIKMYAKGGNAIDAGVAAGFALAVLKPQQNSLGGECPILIYSPVEKKVISISGQGTAPKNANLQWFEQNKINVIPGDGFLGATVPGVFGAYATALLKYGHLTLCDVLEPAMDLARNGFPMYGGLRDMINKNKERFQKEWITSAEIFLINGKVPELGDIFKQLTLANTLQKLIDVEKAARDKGREAAIQIAIDFFYKGKIAEELINFAKNNPVKDSSGEYHTTLLEMEDFISYQTMVEEPIYADYKNYRVYKCGSWTQGPVFLQQLKLLEGFNLKAMGHNSHDYIHTVIECSKLAFSDRDKYYGDPVFTDVPLNRLLSDKYNEEQRKKISNKKVIEHKLSNVYGYVEEQSDAGDTTHLDAVDAEGFMISATSSGGWIQSSPIVPGVGFALGTRAQMFNLKKGHPNCLVPGKRPRTTLTPSLCFKDGKPWMVFGTPGGDMQDQWTLQFFLNVVEFEMNLQQAVNAASFHTEHFIGSFYPHKCGDLTIFTEQGIDVSELYKLQELGHKIHFLRPQSNGEVCSIRINYKNRMIEGAASSKEEGNAYVMGW